MLKLRGLDVLFFLYPFEKKNEQMNAKVHRQESIPLVFCKYI